MGCKSPQNYGWTERVLDKGYQILFLDQRGTGLSETLTPRTLSFAPPQQIADHVKLFRADSIIFICGGLAPLVDQPDLVYRKLFVKVAERNQAYYQKYPEDTERVKNIVRYLQSTKTAVKLPSSGPLSIPRFRSLGINLGFHGEQSLVFSCAIDAVHGVILRMAHELDYFGYFTRPTLAEFESLQSFDTVPLYALIHELIYLQGNNTSAWSADRMMKEHPAFVNLSTSSDEDPIYFTGEMQLQCIPQRNCNVYRHRTFTSNPSAPSQIFPSTFSDHDELRPLADAADILAHTSGWPALYDEAQLARNDVPVYTSIYIDDMYVSFDLAMATARKIRNCKSFVTNAMYHNAISVAGMSDELVKELLKLRDDCLD
ncbi:MAG: hypothetical protein Q9207_003224 [Kuettlingeria erythrocarpa]